MKPTAALLLALGMPLIAGCQFPEPSWDEYQTAQAKCRHDAYDVLSYKEMHEDRFKHPEIDRKYDAAKDACIENWKRDNPNTYAAAASYQHQLDKIPFAGFPDQSITIYHNGHVVGGADVYVPGNGDVIINSY